jgi:HSP20 family molecular chaperone IbpA
MEKTPFSGHDIPGNCRGRSESTADLPIKVHPEGAVVQLQAGMLKFELPKVTKQAQEDAAAV